VKSRSVLLIGQRFQGLFKLGSSQEGTPIFVWASIRLESVEAINQLPQLTIRVLHTMPFNRVAKSEHCTGARFSVSMMRHDH
jgi:hypothetical protein